MSIVLRTDDILVTGAGDDVTEATRDHDANLLALLQRCREKGVRLNRDKLQLNKQSTSFMGHQLTREGLRPDKRKIDAILNMPIGLRIRLLYNAYWAWHLSSAFLSEFQ